MSRILITFPGRFGDVIWLLPTARAIAEAVGHPVDLRIAGEFASILPLLALQPYLGAVEADTRWALSEGWQPPAITAPYDQVIHLGYRRWPELPLPFEIAQTARQEYGLVGATLEDLARPWITVEPRPYYVGIAHGWSDCYFELKVGLIDLLRLRMQREGWLGAQIGRLQGGLQGRSRWSTEGEYGISSWEDAAAIIAAARVFLGDCSALHVLAVALGKPCVVVEPMVERHNPIFWPLGMEGRVRCVKGLDGRPTFDARHTADVLKEVLGV